MPFSIIYFLIDFYQHHLTKSPFFMAWKLVFSQTLLLDKLVFANIILVAIFLYEFIKAINFWWQEVIALCDDVNWVHANFIFQVKQFYFIWI